MLIQSILLLACAPSAVAGTPSSGTDEVIAAPRLEETRVYRILQTVSLNEIPSDAKEVRLWVPVPADGAWQRVLDRRVVEAPEGWKLEKQPVSDGEMVVSTTRATAAMPDTLKVVVETTVMRQKPVFDLASPARGELQRELFTAELVQDAPLMSADAEVAMLASKACGSETDLCKKVVRILDAVADAADHYSKDPTKPSCGRGAAQDCLANGGGCCTDLHSLFIAAARAQGIPARMQYGYRLNPAKENTDYDPSYRCWVEFYLPNAGWVPTDLVVADSKEPADRMGNYGTVDARRVWLWQGRSLELTPRQKGAPIETMSCGWAEIDGESVNVLPGADGKPSKLRRSIRFTDLTPAEAARE